MKKILIFILILMVTLVSFGSSVTEATDELQSGYTFEVHDEDEYQFGYAQVISKSGFNYIVEIKDDGDWLFVTTEKPLYVGNWYILVIGDEELGHEYIVDFMPIEIIETETLIQALIIYYSDVYNIELTESEFLYWISQEEPELYFQIITQWYGTVYYNFDYLN